MNDNPDITALLAAWRRGEDQAESRFLEEYYPVLKRLALKHLRGEFNLTMQATELVNEAWLRLSQQHNMDWLNRRHFLAIAGTLIRRIIVDYMRAKNRAKRGGDVVLLDISDVNEAALVNNPDYIDWLMVDQFISEIVDLDQRAAKILELRFFAGLGNGEIAEELGVSLSTVVRSWRFYRAWLQTRMQDSLH